MKRTPSVLSALLIATLPASARAESPPEEKLQVDAPRPASPNLIYVLADQLRYPSCGFAGDAKARTPHIDRPASQSVVFRNAIDRKGRKKLLFDNVADPYQIKNLSADAEHPSTLAHFRALLKKRMNELDDTFEASTWYRDHWVKDRIITRVR